MTLPRWLARFNRRVVNPRVARSSWPVLVHRGRTSGLTRRTPLDAVPVAGGYLFFINYGPRTDWARNVMAAGKAVLEIDGESVDLIEPRIAPIDECVPMLPDGTVTPPRWVRVEECLLMDQV